MQFTDKFSEHGIEIGNKSTGQIQTTCPQCSESRKKKTDKCLSINIDEGVWNCHHCGWTGNSNSHTPLEKWTNNTKLSDDVVEWFAKRNISQDTLIKMGVSEAVEWMPQTKKKERVICFNYFKDGVLVNTKFRTLVDKNFKLTKDAKLILYNADGIKNQEAIYITEGECDALTLIGQGLTCTVSVPNGANPKSNNLSYIDLKDFEAAKLIYIATDDDEPGHKLAEDIADRLGRYRCHRVLFSGHKDINELYCKEANLDKLTVKQFEQQHTNTTEIKSFDWRAFQITTEPEEAIALLKIDIAPTATAGNYSQIIGKKKSRKSLFLLWLIALYKSLHTDASLCADIILFDTEQGKRHVWKVLDRIRRMTGETIGVFYLRGQSPLERRQIIEQVVKEYPTRPKIVIIDGIRDLLSNINDPDQVSELLTWLEKLTLENSLHVINVLHMNKTDNNARGHLGSELLNKSEVTIELELDEKAECTIVKCESSRDIPFEPFAFRHDVNGLPEVVSLPTAGRVLPEEEKKARLKFMFNDLGDLVKYADLVEGIKANFEVGMNKSKILLADFSRDGWIVKNGNVGRDVFYKCMV
jgi:ribosomal protein L37AE/L43A